MVATVGRLVEAEAGLTVAARVRLTGADVDRLAGGSFGSTEIEPIAFVGMPPEMFCHSGVSERVRRAPDAAACRGHVQAALRGPALRVDGQRGDAARPLRRLVERLRAESVDVQCVRPEGVPGRWSARRCAVRPVVRGDRALDLVDRDAVRGISAVGVRLVAASAASPSPEFPAWPPSCSAFKRPSAKKRDFEDVLLELAASSTAAAAAKTMSPLTAISRRQLIWIPLVRSGSLESPISRRPGRKSSGFEGEEQVDIGCATGQARTQLEEEKQMIGVRTWCASVVAVSAAVLWLGASAGTAATNSGSVGADTAAGCLAHVVGGASEDWYDYYTPGCTGHDEPELDPVSSAPHSARNLTGTSLFRPGGTFPVTSVGPTFWFGGTVKDTTRRRSAARGSWSCSSIPTRSSSDARRTGTSTSSTARRLHGVLAGLDARAKKRQHHRAGRVQRHADERRRHRPARHARPRHHRHPYLGAVDERAYREQVTDETSGETSSVLI